MIPEHYNIPKCSEECEHKVTMRQIAVDSLASFLRNQTRHKVSEQFARAITKILVPKSPSDLVWTCFYDIIK